LFKPHFARPFAILFALAVAPSLIGAASLDDCFLSALKQSETLSESKEAILQAEEHFRQAFGAIMPSASLNYSAMRQDDHALTTDLKASNPVNQNNGNITLDQPLFRGFADFAALREMKDTLASAKDADDWAAMQLYQDVAGVFFTVLSLERDKELLEEQDKLYDGRIKELEDFQAVGRARDSDVETVQAAQALLEASAVQVAAQLAVEREALAFLTGQDPNLALAASDAPPADARELNALLKAAESRPDLQAAMMRDEAAKEFVAVNKGAHLPSVDLLGHWYFVQPGTQNPIYWDASISLTLPLFQGFALVSKDREAESLQRQTQKDLERQRRKVASDIRTAWRSLQGDLAQVTAYERGFDLSDKAYESLKKDFKNGLSTNQDVLLALTSSRDAQRSLEAARFAARNDFEQLQALAGLRLDLCKGRK
jgi:outer membrane protein